MYDQCFGDLPDKPSRRLREGANPYVKETPAQPHRLIVLGHGR